MVSRCGRMNQEEKINHLELLRRCCWGRGLQQLLIHRTIFEFANFLEESIFKGKLKGQIPEDKDPLEFWIEKFYEHCKRVYKFKDEDCPVLREAIEE